MSRSRLLCAGVGFMLTLASVPSALAADQCGSPVIRAEDLKSMARASALAAGKVPARLAGMISVDQFRALDRRAASPAGAVGTAADVEGAWQAGFGLPILNEYPGAAIEFRGELVVAGWLRTAAHQRVSGVARWTADGWAPLGNGIIPGDALAVLDDRLYAGSWTGVVSAWDGEAWTELPPTGLTSLEALEVINGVLVVAGTSDYTKGRVAAFDGVQWRALGDDFDTGATSLGSFQGQIVAGGPFTNNGSTVVNRIARWDGTKWTSLGRGVDPTLYSEVDAIQEFGGRLIVGGAFESCSGVVTGGLAAWDGQSWSAVPGVPSARVSDLLVANSRLYMAGLFEGEWTSVGSWDGATWRSEGLGQWALGLAQFGTGIAVVGGFTGAECPSSFTTVGAAVLDANGWRGLERWDDSMHGLATNVGAGTLFSTAVYHDELIAAGQFQLAGNPPRWKYVPGLARWDGSQWQPVGTNGLIAPLVVAVVGNDLIASGLCSGWSQEGPLTGIARWDGADWHPMGKGLNGAVKAITEYGGRIYAGGNFQILASGDSSTLASFDGVEWSAVPGAPRTARYNQPMVSQLVADRGVLYVGGNFDGPQGLNAPGVTVWDGQSWHALGGGFQWEVVGLQLYHGDLYAGGGLYEPTLGIYDGLFRWTGSAWQPMGLAYTQVTCLALYGDLLVVGGNQGVDRFAQGSLGIVAWDGQQWKGFGTGIAGTPLTMCQMGGDLYVGGWLDRGGDQASFGLAHWAGHASPAPVPVPSDPPSPLTGPGVALAIHAGLVTSDHASLRYGMPTSGHARLDLYDVRGSRVATLFDRTMSAGEGVFEWTPGSPAPFPGSGVYFLRLRFGERTASAKIVFAR